MTFIDLPLAVLNLPGTGSKRIEKGSTFVVVEYDVYLVKSFT